MSELVRPLTDLFRFNSEMVGLGLADLNQEDAVRRWKEGQGSSIAYLAGHVSSSRYGLLKAMSAATENPYAELFGGGVGSRDGSEYPPLEELQRGWADTACKLHAAFDGLTDEQVLQETDGQYPLPEKNFRGRLTFLAWHESYHIGQIGVLRTEMGYPSLRKALYEARQKPS